MEPNNLPVSEQIPQVVESQNPPRAKRKNRFLIIGCVLLVVIITVSLLILTRKGNVQKIPFVAKQLKNAPSISAPNEKENVNAIHADVKLTYLFNPRDNKRIILKQVDFKTNTITEIDLPYFWEYSADPKTRGNYKVSPEGKYVLRTTDKKFEIAQLSSNSVSDFKTIHNVPEIKSKTNGGGYTTETDFAHTRDAMWDSQGNLYFSSEVGASGVSTPFLPYTELYKASEDGSNKKLINDHTSPDGDIGFGRSFNTIDNAKHEIYFGGETESGHLTPLIVLNVDSGKIVSTLNDIATDISYPVFNKDFSKAYYLQDYDEKGYLTPVKIFEYDMNLKTKKLIYVLPGATGKDGDIFSIDRSPISLYLDSSTNILYFEVLESKVDRFYSLNLDGKQSPKVLLEVLTKHTGGYCERIGVSSAIEYTLSTCWSSSTEEDVFQFTQIATGQKFEFFKAPHKGSEIAIDKKIKVVNFK